MKIGLIYKVIDGEYEGLLGDVVDVDGDAVKLHFAGVFNTEKIDETVWFAPEEIQVIA